jgi:hypothetical protein
MAEKQRSFEERLRSYPHLRSRFDRLLDLEGKKGSSLPLTLINFEQGSTEAKRGQVCL